MHEGCLNPVWPCAMTGAVSCLSGFSDLGVILHGSSGCYYYTESIIQAPIHCTFLIEEEIIFGTEKRLREVVSELSKIYDHLAIVTMCVPAITGEDIRQILEGYDVLIIDAPGFIGNMNEGYIRALNEINPQVDQTTSGVNIDGICSIDPFSRGNRMEAQRLLAAIGLKSASIFCEGVLSDAFCAAPVTIHTNPDLSSGIGTDTGSFLGLQNCRDTIAKLGDRFGDAGIDNVLGEIDEAEERIVQSCDKYLRRFDPPKTAIFSTFHYASCAADMLARYLDADVTCIGSRNTCPSSTLPIEQTIDLERIRELIRATEPDLIIGSFYEHALAPAIPFIGLTFPLRGRALLAHRPFVGTEGALLFMEQVLNASMPE